MTALSLIWRCANCALDWPEPFCDSCGRDLKPADLTPATETAASGAPVTETPLTADRSEV